MEEHLESCESCRRLKESIEKESDCPADEKEWDESILPLKKFRKKMRRKNLLIVICVFFFLVFTGITALLTYGQINKTGISFELIYDRIRFDKIGKAFASGNIEPLYENLSNGFFMCDAEASVTTMLYKDEVVYDTGMKKAIMTKYHQYFDGKNLTYKGIEEIGYLDSPGTYHTDDSLFSCMPNRINNNMAVTVTQQIMRISGQRALQGDTTLAEYGQMRLSIKSEQDIVENTDSLRDNMNETLDKLMKRDYYVTSVLLNVKEYDQTKYLYKYEMHIMLTNKNSLDNIVVSLDCYRIGDNFVYIDGSDKVYGDNLSPEILEILGELCQ